MKAALSYIVCSLAVFAVGGIGLSLGCSKAGEKGPGEGYPVVCSQPGCGHFFVISPGDIQTYPRGADGEGFKCEKCAKFGAKIAARCDQCKQWYLPREGSRGAAGCPKCAPTTAEKKPQA